MKALFQTRYTKNKNTICIVLLNEKKSAQKVWSKDLMHEKTFRLSSQTPHAYTVSQELLLIDFINI